MKAILKPILMRLLLSAGVSVIMGIAASLLYFISTCWDGRIDCPGYSPTGQWIAFVLVAPVSLMEGPVKNVLFDPVVYRSFELVALWAYYFMIISGVMALYRHRNSGFYARDSRPQVPDSQIE